MSVVAAPESDRACALRGLLARGDVYGFLNAAAQHLRDSPEDGVTREAAVGALAALGLSDAARGLLEGPACTADLRERLLSRIAGSSRRVSWSRFDATFQANVEPFGLRTGLRDELLSTWRAVRRQLELHQTVDGAWQIYDTLRGCWLPALTPPVSPGQRESLRGEWSGRVIRTIAVAGLGLGGLAGPIVAASQSTFLTSSPLVLLVESSLAAWAVAMHLYGWTALLNDPRVRLCAGDRALAEFEQYIADIDRATPVVISGGPRWPGGSGESECVEKVDAEVARRRGEQQAAFTRVTAGYALDDAALAERFAAAALGETALRVVGITSRFTTVLQYTLRDLLAAFEMLGHRTHLIIEPDDHAHYSPLTSLRAIEEHQPDLFINIDHLRREYPSVLPDGLPSVCWVQDMLPNLMNPAAGAGVHPREFVIGHNACDLLTDFGYPGRRTMNCAIPVNPARFNVDDASEAELAPYRCDVMYATHAPPHAGVAQRVDAARRNMDAGLRAVFDAAYDELSAEMRRPHFTGEIELDLLLTRVERRLGGRFNDLAVRGELVQMLRGVADQHLREQAIRTAAAWAIRSGGTFALYGHGWDRHTEFAPHARGPLTPGRELALAFRAAKVCLHAGCNHSQHQRVLDGLCAGGFFLMQRRESEAATALYESIYRLVAGRRSSLPCDVTIADIPEPLRPRFSALLAALGLTRGGALTVTKKWWITFRALFEARSIHMAGAVWPEYERVVFIGPEELNQRLEHFTQADEERARLAADMRRAVELHCSYAALVRRLLEFVAGGLSGSSTALDEGPEDGPPN
ncbi:hypothetical protein RAS1_38240 [Phycisphaerae bacterium RAS1]|nr:hypothetical protein RAS1_38240 [Phycisphaerae bacterium RAS1]